MWCADAGGLCPRPPAPVPPHSPLLHCLSRACSHPPRGSGQGLSSEPCFPWLYKAGVGPDLGPSRARSEIFQALRDIREVQASSVSVTVTQPCTCSAGAAAHTTSARSWPVPLTRRHANLSPATFTLTRTSFPQTTCGLRRTRCRLDSRRKGVALRPRTLSKRPREGRPAHWLPKPRASVGKLT